MESFFPEFLRGHKDYRVFIKMATEEFGEISDYIELFTELPDIDRTPEKFIGDLGKVVGYSYIDEVDPDVQREIIKRWFNKQEARGDEDSLIMMASHAQNNGYLGGDIFVPGTYKPGQEAVLTFPRDTLYTWNKSKRSAYDKYPDGIVAIDGVIEILVGYIDENVRRRTEEVKPAGVRLYFKMSVAIVGEDVVVKIKWPRVWIEMMMEISKYISCHMVTQPKYNVWDGLGAFMVRSGRVRQEFHFMPEIKMSVSSKKTLDSIKEIYYPHYDMEDLLKKSLAIPIQVIKQFTGTPGWSDNFIWDGKFARSGLRNGYIELDAPYDKRPELRNPLLTIDEMKKVHTDGRDHFAQSPFEIEIKRGNPEIHLAVRGQYLKDSLIPDAYPNDTMQEIVDKDRHVPIAISIRYEGVPKWSIDHSHSGRYGRSGHVLDIEERRYPGVPKWSVDFKVSGRIARSGQEGVDQE